MSLGSPLAVDGCSGLCDITMSLSRRCVWESTAPVLPRVPSSFTGAHMRPKNLCVTPFNSISVPFGGRGLPALSKLVTGATGCRSVKFISGRSGMISLIISGSPPPKLARSFMSLPLSISSLMPGLSFSKLSNIDSMTAGSILPFAILNVALYTIVPRLTFSLGVSGTVTSVCASTGLSCATVSAVILTSGLTLISRVLAVEVSTSLSVLPDVCPLVSLDVSPLGASGDASSTCGPRISVRKSLKYFASGNESSPDSILVLATSSNSNCWLVSVSVHPLLRSCIFCVSDKLDQRGTSWVSNPAIAPVTSTSILTLSLTSVASLLASS